jgi:hypothetical protein
MKFKILWACVAFLLSLKQNLMYLLWSLKEGKTLNLLQRALPLREANCEQQMQQQILLCLCLAEIFPSAA